MWIEFIWLKTGTSDSVLWKLYYTFVFYKKNIEISYLIEQLLASQGFYSMEFVMKRIWYVYDAKEGPLKSLKLMEYEDCKKEFSYRYRNPCLSVSFLAD
jgi:hypothetical protein